MKEILFIPCFLFISQCSFCQITITEIDEQIPQKTKTIIPFDSLENIFCSVFSTESPLKNKESLIGLELYLPTGNSTGEYFSSTNVSNISNKYYTVLDVFGFDVDMHGRTMNVSFASGTHTLTTPIIFMVDKKSGDSVYLDLYRYNGNINHFILIPNFEKLKQLYDNTYVICTSPSDYNDEKDIVNNQKVKVGLNSKWLCNVLVTKTLGHPYYDLYFVLKNENNQTIAFECNSSSVNKGNFYRLRLEGSGVYAFLTEKQFAKNTTALKIKEEKETSTSIANATQQRLKKDKYRADCIKMFGQVFGDAIASKKVKIGMTKVMSELAWDKPYSVSKTTTEDRVLETWNYGLTRTLLFVNGILQKIEE